MTNENQNQDSDEFDATDAAFDASGQQDDGEPSVQFTETRDDEMQRLREAADSADKRVLMAQAEAENFRKRMRRDFEDQVKYAAVPLVNDILQVRDNLHRAIDSAGDGTDVAGLRDGVAIVAKQLDDMMAKHSIREIPAEGELFDPNFHEAISQMPSDKPAGIVAHVAATGFQMHDRVIRPSQVIVSTGPAE
ncbi:heat shock protein GrpE [Rubripirellula lacrimiformis]|uniref:Protein GrpE n=1 Tax=Rubripirellula lacrimiformis TaxID=1930273 RepID=A0A517NGB4_9BACT|nr:nucleotide exchange factor GrpE [Rubripirellula lacrimiformis]QDT06175.1 heat shock protein GrpE [Rubripirellula lacrimiformis]